MFTKNYSHITIAIILVFVLVLTPLSYASAVPLIIYTALTGSLITEILVVQAIVTAVLSVLLMPTIQCLVDSGAGKSDVFDICDDDSGGGGSGGGGTVGGATDYCDPLEGQTCTSPENACGLVNQGVYSCEGECPAIDPPPMSDCPPPQIDNFRTIDDVYFVKTGNRTTVVWDGIVDAITCILTGPDGFSKTYTYASGESPEGSELTDPITKKSLFELTCQNGEGGPITSASFFINLVPVFQEI